MVAAATRERVLAAAEEMGFRLNASARALTTGHTGLVGVIVPTLANPFFPPILTGVQEELQTVGGNVVLAVSEHSAESEQALADRLASHVDGLILVAPVSPDAAVRTMAQRLPTVTIDRTVRGLPGVLVDVPGGVRDLVNHLVELGHRRIAYLGGPPSSWMDQRRRLAATEAVRAADGELVVLRPVPPRIDAGLAAAEHIANGASVTAIIAYSSYVLLGLLIGLHNAGLRVPEDISLAASDDLTLLGTTQPSITALHVPLDRAGAAASQLVLNADTTGKPAKAVRIDTQLVVRESTAPARA
ncbi:transcriptional regulator, LacI family [Goodfellowiella coeruleoviolacea]|uniref:Transcriptional regulator, LacI family n=2 Tax=Goodfellowiella coeruleoviolacea TaxID=334858 RepID=A0AAE3GA24_9PSEU|nr:transcriptional regulator, LacI family [Goodfellowiella coeruleoviolacea]